MLRRRGTAHAVIGAAALAAHGVSRATADLDLLIVDTSCLDEEIWSDLVRTSLVDVRRGDSDDPLAGVIRIARAGEGSVDVIVGRSSWQREVLERAETRSIGRVSLPVVRAADLILLKLYAGGPQDVWDITRLVEADPRVASEVEARLAQLPADCGSLWRRALAGRESR
jgi:predicted nucleotidyltransferase